MSTREKTERELNALTESFLMQSTCITNNAAGIVYGVSGSQTQYDKCVTEMTGIVNKTAQLKQSLKTNLDQMYTTQSQTVNSVNVLDSNIVSLEKEVESARALNEIRKEQAATLQNKGDSTFHSSWLGLWRPLQDEYRVGIAVTALGLALIACLVLGLLVYEGRIQVPFMNQLIKMPREFAFYS